MSQVGPNISAIYEMSIKPFLFDKYHIRVKKVETTHSPRIFAHILRFLVERNPGKSGIGGTKYVATILGDFSVSDLYTRERHIRELIQLTWAGYKLDQVLGIWGCK